MNKPFRAVKGEEARDTKGQKAKPKQFGFCQVTYRD